MPKMGWDDSKFPVQTPKTGKFTTNPDVAFSNPKTGSLFTKAQVYDMIKHCLEVKLPEYEGGFIASIRSQWSRTGTLTEPQIIFLEDVYSRFTK